MKETLIYLGIVAGYKAAEMLVSKWIEHSKHTEKTKVDDYISEALGAALSAVKFILPGKKGKN